MRECVTRQHVAKDDEDQASQKPSTAIGARLRGGCRSRSAALVAQQPTCASHRRSCTLSHCIQVVARAHVCMYVCACAKLLDARAQVTCPSSVMCICRGLLCHSANLRPCGGPLIACRSTCRSANKREEWSAVVPRRHRRCPLGAGLLAEFLDPGATGLTPFMRRCSLCGIDPLQPALRHNLSLLIQCAVRLCSILRHMQAGIGTCGALLWAGPPQMKAQIAVEARWRVWGSWRLLRGRWGYHVCSRAVDSER